MSDTKIDFLIEKAKKLMSLSRDPIHDLSHVQRVVHNAERISTAYQLTKEECEAVKLAAWWHDVARVLTRKPSFVWMACVDDILSAIMLCLHSIRYGFWKHSGGIATKLILSKTVGTGAVFTKLLLTKRERILIHILRDSDMLDIIHIDRLTRVCELSQTSKKYWWGFRCLLLYNTRESAMRMKTSIAHHYLIESIEAIIQWMEERQHDPRYARFFEEVWIRESIKKFKLLHRKLAPIQQSI